MPYPSTFKLIGDNPPFDISITLDIKTSLKKSVQVLWHIKGNNSGSIKFLFIERSIDNDCFYAIEMRSINNSMQLSNALNSSFNDTYDANQLPSYRIRLVLKHNIIFSTPSILAPKF